VRVSSRGNEPASIQRFQAKEPEVLQRIAVGIYHRDIDLCSQSQADLDIGFRDTFLDDNYLVVPDEFRMRHYEWMISKGKTVKLEPAPLVGFSLGKEPLLTVSAVVGPARVAKVADSRVCPCQRFARDSVDHSAANPATMCR
jgi:hypothetical protein